MTVIAVESMKRHFLNIAIFRVKGGVSSIWCLIFSLKILHSHWTRAVLRAKGRKKYRNTCKNISQCWMASNWRRSWHTVKLLSWDVSLRFDVFACDPAADAAARSLSAHARSPAPCTIAGGSNLECGCLLYPCILT